MLVICKCSVLAFLLAIWSVIFPFLISPYERAIKCSEVRIMHRPTILHPDVDYVFLLLIPTVTVLVLFMVMTFLRKDASNRDQMRRSRIKKGDFNNLSEAAFLAFFVLGYSLCAFICSVASLAVGYLAPNFFAVCKPDLQLFIQQCNSTGAKFFSPNCTSDRPESRIAMARSSCPSIWLTLWSFIMMTLIV